MAIETWGIPFEAYTGDRPYAFVSYAHRDREIVFDDIRELHRKGFRLWYDEGIDPGLEWAEEVASALYGCEVFIVYLSPNAVESRNVRNEINFALNHDKRFIAIHVARIDLPRGLELRIADIQAIMRYRMAPETYIQRLEKALDNGAGARGWESLSVPGSVRGQPTGEQHDSPITPEPRRAGELLDTIKRLHRAGRWAEIREIGPEAAELWTRLMERSPDDTFVASKLINLSAFLTDAEVKVSARRCLDVAIDALLRSIHEHGESLTAFDFLGMAYNNLGRLLRTHNPSSRGAESFYRKSQEIFGMLYPGVSDEMDLGDRLGMAFTNLGNSLLSQGKYQASREAYRGAVETYERILRDYPGSDRMQRRLAENKANLDRVRKQDEGDPRRA